MWWWLALGAVVVVAGVIAVRSSSDGSTSVVDSLEVGDCFVAPNTDAFTSSEIHVVGCDEPHDHEVYAIGTTDVALATAASADENPEIVRVCRTDVAPAILATLAATPGVTPGVVASRDRAGRIVCTANTAIRTGSLLAASSA